MIITLLLSIFVGLFSPAHACTTFLYAPAADTVRFGRNLDWDWDHGLLMVNKRNVAKSAIVMDPSLQPARWTSHYGSLTFNQVGRELPFGGMNEKGLVVETLWLQSAEYPAVGGTPAINEGQWVQYQLDNYATVAELVAHVNDVRIAKVFANVHFLACDATAACATIEPIRGSMVVHTGASLPVKAITNDTYDDSLAYANGFLSRNDCASLPRGSDSLDRFARVACGLAAPTRADPVTRTLELLKGSDQGDYTKWSIAYDPVHQRIDFRTFKQNQVRHVSLKDFDLSCASPVQVHEINSPEAGDLRPTFVSYTQAADRAIAEKSLKGGMADMPPQVIDLVVAYPEATRCLGN